MPGQPGGRLKDEQAFLRVKGGRAFQVGNRWGQTHGDKTSEPPKAARQRRGTIS